VTAENRNAAYTSLRRELATIFGPVQPRKGQTWNEAMLIRITETLVAERDNGYQEGLDNDPMPEPWAGAYSPANEEWIARRQADERDPFADDVLERLIQSNGEYQRAHGHYIVPLAARLLAARREIAQLKRDNEHAYTAYRELTEGRP